MQTINNFDNFKSYSASLYDTFDQTLCGSDQPPLRLTEPWETWILWVRFCQFCEYLIGCVFQFYNFIRVPWCSLTKWIIEKILQTTSVCTHSKYRYLNTGRWQQHWWVTVRLPVFQVRAYPCTCVPGVCFEVVCPTVAHCGDWELVVGPLTTRFSVWPGIHGHVTDDIAKQ